MKIFCQFFTV